MSPSCDDSDEPLTPEEQAEFDALMAEFREGEALDRILCYYEALAVRASRIPGTDEDRARMQAILEKRRDGEIRALNPALLRAEYKRDWKDRGPPH